MTALVRCPKCGQMEGIRLYHASEGMTDCQCAACGRVVCTCPDGDHDECWNAAGAHAQGLRDRIAVLEAALRNMLSIVQDTVGASWQHDVDAAIDALERKP